MSDGITVLPVRSTRTAPSGGWCSPFLPTHVKLSPSTRNAELSIGALPSPTISRAPSKNSGLPPPPWKPAAIAPAQVTIRKHGQTRDNGITLLPRYRAERDRSSHHGSQYHRQCYRT